jgi:tRNA threonylcarbamoyladenosine biosynthesis protein TsaB
MIVLGFDTATASTVVGLTLADGCTMQARDDPAAEERPGHSTRLLPLADRLLADAGLDWNGVGRLAVGVGPGTFTGLRIGVAIARGLSQSSGVPLVGVSSLRALAHDASERNGDEQAQVDLSGPAHGSVGTGGLEGPEGRTRVLAVIDARRGEMFVAAYDGGVELLAPHAVGPDELGGLLAGAAIDTGAESWIAVGDGAVLHREAIERLGVPVPGDGSELHRIQARAICALGAAADVTEAPVVVPDYRRRPDAEIALEGVAS